MSETVLLLGSGSREHAIAWKLSQSPKVKNIFVAPGNGGIKAMRGNVQVIDLDIKTNKIVVEWCNINEPSLVVIGPEDPLDNGIADDLRSMGFLCFGPNKAAAQIECSKRFAKDFMARHGIPTAKFQSFTDTKDAKEFVRKHNALVVKASGLAAGKGVIVANDIDEAYCAIETIRDGKFGSAGDTVIIEELLKGDEVSVLAFTDGKNISVMPPAQDHKRAFENDTGPNTGGMGAFCPYPMIDDKTLKFIEKEIIQKTIDCLHRENTPFIGVIYAGLMLTSDGPKVIEFNCRFGDPETQSILALLNSDLFDTLLACANGNLPLAIPKWKSQYACGVVVASGGYPDGPIVKGKIINGVKDVENEGLIVFHGGTQLKDGNFYTSGGRILSVVAVDNELSTAVKKSLHGASLIKIENAFYRKDIAKRTIDRVSNRLDYKSSGVDIDAGNALVDHIKKFAKSTNRSGVIDQIGGFGALFDPKNAGYRDPILVSGTDGVGTKLKVAIECKIVDYVGIDLVAMCANDILVQGAEPLFFLDYFACSQLDVPTAARVIKGISEGCKLAKCALIGGETAEMPGMYEKGDFDLAGFCVGAVERHSLIPIIDQIKENDTVIGLSSNGVHSNGFSLIRKLFEIKSKKFTDITPFNKNCTFGDVLLTPTKIYVESLISVIKMGYIKALAHITGGGLLENIPRILPKELGVELNALNWHIHDIFRWIQKEGNVDEEEMLKTFNCGLGMICIVDPSNADATMRAIKSSGDDAFIVGKVIKRQNESVIVHNYSKSSIKTESKPKKRVAVLLSGTGTNLQALIDHTQNKSISSAAHIALVISSKSGVQGLDRAESAGITTLVIPSKDFGKDREGYDMTIHKALTEASIDIVCLAGFMRILTKKFITLWNGKLINIHPSLLPSFKGMHAYKQALDAGVRITGCTVHFVDAEVDAGAIIDQETVPIELRDTEEILQERGKRAEHKLYPRALELLAQEKLKLSDDGRTIVWNI